MSVGSQLGARVLTFVLNLVAARLLSPDDYGVSAVQFHLINSSILFLSREGVRRSCLRIEYDESSHFKLLSASLMAVPAGIMFSIAGILLVGRHASDGHTYQVAAQMQCLAALLEIISEPFYIFSTARMWFGVRTGCEAGANIVKNFVSVYLLARGHVAPSMAMSWGQVAYGGSLLVLFMMSFTLFDPSWAGSVVRHASSWRRVSVDAETMALYWAFSVQAAGKLVLAEGSKAVLAIVTSPTVQGVYGLVNNLGSLVVRTLFQPYEEIVFVAFSKDGGHAASRDRLTSQADLLSSLCQCICIIGGISACFGPSYSYVALRVLYGERWASSDAPVALAMYSIYVALLALNGTLEAFLHGVADKKYLYQNNMVLVVTSLTHIGLSVGAVTMYGALGLLMADSVNMILRIAYCRVFMRTYFGGIGGLKAIRMSPSARTVMVLVTSLCCTKLSQAVLLPDTLTGYETYLAPVWKVLDLRLMGLYQRMAVHVSIGVVFVGAVMASVHRHDLRRLEMAFKNVRKEHQT